MLFRSLTPEKKRTAIEMGNVAGYTVEELHISLTSRAPYKTAGEFFRALREEFPIYARVNQVNFGKESEKGTGMLTVDFDVDTYLLVPAGAAK